jgi:serine/threonine-protein kinase
MTDKGPPAGSAAPGPSVSGQEPDLTGQTLGDFRVLHRLGQGGMGQVYLAEQISLKRKVALKVLRAEAAQGTSLQRFQVEAEAVARATHANIVQVYWIGEANGQYFMALEYVEGRNLRDFVEKKGPPEVLVAISIMRQVAAALQRASELGVIHRDIKPENILLTRKGEVKVADFGLSRIADGQPLNLTQTGVSMGTPLYMSPEQVEGKAIDARTDIYSFGATCYHLLAGQPPFRGQTPFEVAFQHVQNEPVPLAQVRPDLPAELCAIVHKMMAKKREQRYQNGAEIVQDLARLRDALVGVTGGQPTLAISQGPQPAAPGDLATTQISFALAPRRRYLPWLAAGSIALALAGGLLAGRLWRSKPEPPPDRPSLRTPTAAQEREKELLRSIQLSSQPEDQLTRMSGLRDRIELGFLYLEARRLDDADRFFKNLDRAEEKTRSYRQLGKLGQAMVLAFQDKPMLSNRQFLLALKGEGFSRSWLNRPRVREMVALALDQNLKNAPKAFPESLKPLLRPPQPAVKSADKKGQ